MNEALRRCRPVIFSQNKNKLELNHDGLNNKSWQTNVINFCSNDYLQLSKHKTVINAFIRAAQKFGIGSSSAPHICGYQKPHQQLEEALSHFLKRERTVLFTSGYLANLAVLTTFANRNSVIIADKFSHASLIDGANLSRAKLIRYHHQNYFHANELANLYSAKKKIIVSESIFSMHGAITDIKVLAKISADHHSLFVVDDAHGFGILGEKGSGIAEHFAMNAKEIDCLITPFGKSLANVGAAVSGSHEIIETILQNARPYRYSTSLPPALCMAALQALYLIQEETWRREKLQSLILFFREQAKEHNLPFIISSTPIQCLIVHHNKIVIDIQRQLLIKGLLVAAIRPPTVSNNTARIRISLNCLHTKSQIIYLLDQLKIVYENNRKN